MGKMTGLKNIKQKELFVFDLDGTLAESKLPMDREMEKLLAALLKTRKVAVIGGGKYGLFENQLLQKMKKWDKKLLRGLFLFPTNATRMYRYDKKWKQIYEYRLSKKEIKKISKAFGLAFQEINYAHPKKTYGEIIEDRGTQVTFSALGQKAPVALKEEWNKKRDVRKKLMRVLLGYLPEFEVRQGGLTSIDVTRKGIDKAYGIKEIERHLHISKKKMLFAGDAIFPGGNDYAVVKVGVDYVKVGSAEDTKQLLTKIIGMLQ